MRYLIFILAVLSSAASAGDFWPDAFGVHAVAESVDSPAVSFSTRQVRDEGDYSGRSELALLNTHGSRVLAQQVIYQLDYDLQGILWEHFVGLPGKIVSHKSVAGCDYVALEWKPGLFLDKGETQDLLEGRLSAGPLVQYSPGGVPVRIAAGGAGVLWNDSLDNGVVRGVLENRQSNAGGYAQILVPGFERPVANSNLYSDVSLFAQALGKSKLLLGSGQAVLRRGLESGDSLYMSLADTLSFGNESFFGSAGGEQRYVSRPNEQRNAIGAGAGIRGKARLKLVPSAALWSTWRTVVNSRGEIDPRNERGTDRTLSLQLDTDSSAWLWYRGGIRFDRGERDRLPGTTFAATLPADSLRGAYDLNTADLERYGARMVHQLQKVFPNKMGVLYRFSLSRDSRTYPFEYIDRAGRTRDNDEGNDLVVLRHFAELTALDKDLVTMRLQGEYRKTIINYLHQRRSAVNTTDSTFMLGTTVRLRLFDRINLYDTTRIGADVTRYHFAGERPPNEGSPYSRTFLSHVRLEVALSPVWGVIINWRERYDDAGRWYATQFVDTSLLDPDQRFANGYDYYGPEVKTWDHSVAATVVMSRTSGVRAEVGVRFEDVAQVLWEPDRAVRDFTVSLSDRGASLRAITDITLPLKERLAVQARIMPVVYLKNNPGTKGFFVSESYFDMRVQLQLSL